jgi:ribose transport system substrate-binding protein
VIPKATSHLFWLSVEKGARAAGEQLNVELVWSGAAAETDYARQIEIMESMINRGVDAIAVAAAERKALNQSLERAAAAKIPVTVFDSGVDSENYLTFVATNNYEAGKMAARTLAELIGGAGKVAMVMHAPGSASTMDRERGFTDALKEFPKMALAASQFGMSDRAKALAAAENMLTANPDLNGMFGSSEPSSVGISQALKARGLAGRVKCVAFDSSDGLMQDVRDGVVQALVVQDPFKIGFEAVKTLVDHLNGKTPPKRIDLGARVLRKADI